MAILLPTEIQSDYDLYAQNEELRVVRAELGEAVAKIESGSYSIKRSLIGLIERMNYLIDTLSSAVETTVIPKDKFADFEMGLVSLDDYGSFDIIDYYNGLTQLRIAGYGISVALMQISESPTKPVTPALTQESGILDSLDTREFIEQGAENPVFEAQQSYKYYVIVQGDTLPVIAAKMYNGDFNRWPEISQANGLFDSDLMTDEYVGVTIKIPVDAVSAGNLQSDNLVFEKLFDGTGKLSVTRYNYGRDIYLFRDESGRGRMQPSDTGDIRRMEGESCVVNNLQSRFMNVRGALNPLQIEWGLQKPMNASNVPFVIALDRTISDMESQCMNDPRVVSATAIRKGLRVEGDVIRVDMDIDLIGGNNITNTFDVRNLL